MTQMPPDPQPSPRLPKAALIRLIATLSQVQTLWRDDKGPESPGMRPGLEAARIWLRIPTVLSVGTDEERVKFNTVTQQNDIIHVGQRQFTLSIRGESLDGRLEGYDLCERIRFRLRTQVARSIFGPAMLSLRDIQPTFVTSMKADTRTMRVGTMDVRWNWVAVSDPFDPGEGNWIQTINGGGIIPGVPPGTAR